MNRKVLPLCGMLLGLALAGCGSGVSTSAAPAVVPSPPVVVTPPPPVVTTPPAVPTALQETTGNAQVTLAWTGNGSSYIIERGTNSGGPYTQIGTPTAASYTDTSATNGTTYYYVVAAVNSAGTSAVSGQVIATPLAPVSMTFNLNGSHVFLGFSAQTWVTDISVPALTAVLTNTNVTFNRLLNISPKLLPGDLQNGMTVPQMVNLFNARQSALLTQQTAASAALMRQLNLTTLYVIAGMPSPWVIITTGTDGTKHYTANPDHLQDYADYVAAETLFAQQAGFPIKYLEATGEPNGDWDTLWSPTLYAQMIALVHGALIANGMTDIVIEGPGTSTESAAAPYIQAMAADIAAGYIGAISVHAYDSAKLGEDVFAIPATMQAAIAALTTSPQLPIHVTEFNEENKIWNDAPFCGGPTTRCSPNNSADSPDFAVSVAALALKQFGDGVSLASIWQAQDQSWETTSFGMIDEHGNPRPTATAFTGIFQPLGKTINFNNVVGGTTTAPGIYAAAFSAQSNGAIAGLSASFANTTTTATALAVQLQLTPAMPGYSIASQSVLLGSGPNTSTTNATLSNGALTVTLPPRSVVTMTLGF